MGKYNAARKYSLVDPVEYEKERFSTVAGKLIDDIEKETVLELLINNLTRKNEEKFKILDLATGTGRLAFYIERNIPQSVITAVDINTSMVRGAQRNARKYKSKVSFVQADIYKLPFNKSEFDAIVGLRFSMHLSEIDEVVYECLRVLKKNGLLIFDVFNIDSILRFRSKNLRFYSSREIINKILKKGFEIAQRKGILLLGETLVRKTPQRLLFLSFPTLKPPPILEKISTKLVLCFRKI